MEAVVLDSVVKEFHTNDRRIKAVDSLSLSIPSGKIVGLLGPNGAGKTTTIRMIASIYQTTSGSISVHGYDVRENSLVVRQMIGIAHENPSFYKKLTGRRNLRFYAELYDMKGAEINSRIDELATEFDLTEAIDQPVGGYSKGMRQKLSVAKALVHDPDILVLDEPWSGLSPGATRDLRLKIQDLGKQNKTILISTHNLSQAEQVVDNLVLISKGSMVASGSPQDLRDQYHLNPQIVITIERTPVVDNNLTSELESAFDFVSKAVLDNIPGKSISNNVLTLTVDLDVFSHTPEVIKYLVSKDVQIREIRENIPSLEDIYLELVEDGRR